MHRLLREAYNITKELGSVFFVGAVAVFVHTKNTRESLDLDFVIANPIPDEDLIAKGYAVKEGRKKKLRYTPRGYKIDIYDSRALNEIPIDTIIRNSVSSIVGKKNESINVMSLETLIVSKFRANREQDNYDLKLLATSKFSEIDEGNLSELTKGDYEFREIMETMKFYAQN